MADSLDKIMTTAIGHGRKLLNQIDDVRVVDKIEYLKVVKSWVDAMKMIKTLAEENHSMENLLINIYYESTDVDPVSNLYHLCQEKIPAMVKIDEEET